MNTAGLPEFGNIPLKRGFIRNSRRVGMVSDPLPAGFGTAMLDAKVNYFDSEIEISSSLHYRTFARIFALHYVFTPGRLHCRKFAVHNNLPFFVAVEKASIISSQWHFVVGLLYQLVPRSLCLNFGVRSGLPTATVGLLSRHFLQK